MSQITDKVKARFYRKVKVTSGCWIWIGARRGSKGYGAFYIGGTVYSPHRVMFAIKHPEHEETMLTKRRGAGYRTDYILHSCDNPSCVNPNHLRMGSATENVEDIKLRRRNESVHCPPARKGQSRIGHPTQPRSAIHLLTSHDGEIVKSFCGIKGSIKRVRIAPSPENVTCKTCQHFRDYGCHPATKNRGGSPSKPPRNESGTGKPIGKPTRKGAENGPIR